MTYLNTSTDLEEFGSISYGYPYLGDHSEDCFICMVFVGDGHEYGDGRGDGSGKGYEIIIEELQYDEYSEWARGRALEIQREIDEEILYMLDKLRI
jgi:hypothetical protein